MDDEDIVFDEDSPEIKPGDLDGGILRFNGRAPTQSEIEEAKRQILAYINRPRRAK